MVGPVRVNRPLPTKTVNSVGPFVLFDHFGPVSAPKEKLPAHPHAGIEVMTYLLDGANEHTDSLGNVGQIDAGGAQWMKSGSGILHTERNLVERSPIMHGLQLWARLPIAEQDTNPEYRAFQSDEMEVWSDENVRYRLIAGQLGERTGPLALALPAVMAHILLSSSSTISLPETKHEYAIYVIETDAPIIANRERSLGRGDIIRLADTSQSVALELADNCRAEIFLFGGQTAPQPLIFGGSFVLDSEMAIREANRRFHTGGMGTLDGVPF